MTDLTTPTTDELWQLLQEERAQRAQLTTQLTRLERQLAQLPHRTATAVPIRAADGREHRVSRATVLGAAGLAGVALAGRQVTSAFADTPPPLPGLTSFPNPRRVFGDGTVITAGTTTAAIDATPAGVPAGASSAYCAVQATNPGVLTLFPDGASDPLIANWANTGAAGQLALFYMLVPLSAAGKFKIHTYLTGQIYVDVWGYLL